MRFVFAKENEKEKVGKQNWKNYKASILSVPWARLLLRKVTADASFVCCVVAVLRETLKDTPCVRPRSRILNCLKKEWIICTNVRNSKKTAFLSIRIKRLVFVTDMVYGVWKEGTECLYVIQSYMNVSL